MIWGQVISPEQVSYKQGFPIVFMKGDGLWNRFWKGTSFPPGLRCAWGWIPSLAWLVSTVTPFSAKFRKAKSRDEAMNPNKFRRWNLEINESLHPHEKWHNLTYKTSNSRYSIWFRFLLPKWPQAFNFGIMISLSAISMLPCLSDSILVASGTKGKRLGHVFHSYAHSRIRMVCNSTGSWGSRDLCETSRTFPISKLSYSKKIELQFWQKVIGQWANHLLRLSKPTVHRYKSARHGFAERPSAEMPPARSDAGRPAYGSLEPQRTI